MAVEKAKAAKPHPHHLRAISCILSTYNHQILHSLAQLVKAPWSGSDNGALTGEDAKPGTSSAEGTVEAMNSGVL